MCIYLYVFFFLSESKNSRQHFVLVLPSGNSCCFCFAVQPDLHCVQWGLQGIGGTQESPERLGSFCHCWQRNMKGQGGDYCF